jgi:polyphenol oxidase
LTLPPAPPAFRWRNELWGAALACDPFDAYAQHMFTTKQLELHAGDAEGRWNLVAQALGTTADCLLRVKQVHGRNVRIVRDRDLTPRSVAERPEADAIISNAPGAVLAVQVADCVPMLVVDPRSGAAGAVHAGWRGTAAGISGATLAAMNDQFGSNPDEMIVCLGPSIGSCCYEVGEELVTAFKSQGATDDQLARWFTRTPTNSLRLDLWTANFDLLVAAGVRPQQIYLSRLCTQTHADVFDSYRAEGTRAGRMIAAIRVPRI